MSHDVVNQEFSIGTQIKHDYRRKILYYHSNLTKKLKLNATKSNWFTSTYILISCRVWSFLWENIMRHVMLKPTELGGIARKDP